MPIQIEESKLFAETDTVFGGGASEDKVVETCKDLLTVSLKPDMLIEPVRDRFVDGVLIKTWTVRNAIP